MTVMTVARKTDIAMAGVSRLKVQARCIGVTLVAFRAVVHSWFITD